MAVAELADEVQALAMRSLPEGEDELFMRGWNAAVDGIASDLRDMAGDPLAVPSPVPAGTGEAESREPRWSNGEMDDPPPGCQHGYPRRCPADDPPADETLEQTIDRAFNSDAQRYGTMVGVRRTAFAAGYRAALAAPSPASPAETREGRADVGTELVDQVEAYERGDLDEPLAEWEQAIAEQAAPSDFMRGFRAALDEMARWAESHPYTAPSLPGEQPGGQER